MAELIRFILPAYFLLFFGIAIVLKSVRVAKQIGKNPFVLPQDDSAYGLIGSYFKRIMLTILIYTLVFALFPGIHSKFMPIVGFESPPVQYTGIALLIVSLIWVTIAQNNMKASWRIGIDTKETTELITDGLFSISRNPIFLGMIVSLFGLFLCTPNALTAIFLINGNMLIHIQIRLEEAYLTKHHGDTYLTYKAATRRFL